MTDWTAAIVTLVIIFLVVIVVLVKSIHTIRPYEVGVVILLGAYKRLLRPGFSFTSPLARVVRVDLRTRQLTLAPWSVPVIGGPLRLRGTVAYQVVDAARATFQTSDLESELGSLTKSAVTTSFRGMDVARAGSAALELSAPSRDELDRKADRFGVKVTAVELELATA